MALKLIDEDWIDEMITAYIHKRDGWKEDSANYATYDLIVREYRKIKSSQLLPLPDSSDQEQIKESMDKLTDDQRYELISNYCKHCGSKDSNCQCWNDE